MESVREIECFHSQGMSSNISQVVLDRVIVMESTNKRINIVGVEEEGSEESSPNHLVFDTVIHWAIENEKDIYLDHLKLVSKAWNESICSALRSYSFVVIDESADDKTETFIRILKERKGLPLPFRKIYLYAYSFTQPNFMDFIQNFLQDFVVTHFMLEYNEDLSENYQEPLHQILTNHRETLRNLLLRRAYYSRVRPNKFDLEKIKFPNLKELDIDFDENVESILKEVLANGKLEILGIQFIRVDPTLLQSFRSLESVPELHFTIVGTLWSDGDFLLHKFTKLHLPNVKELSLCRIDQKEVKDALQVISRWSASLEVIHFVFAQMPLDHRLPVLPKLTNMAINDQDYNYEIDPEKLPSLEEIHFWSPPLSLFDDVPHLGVKKLEFFPRKNSFYGRLDWDCNGTAQEQFLAVLTLFGEVFPNVEDFTCDISSVTEEEGLDGFSSAAIAAIQESFPGLKEVTLRGDKIPLEVTIDQLTKQWSIIRGSNTVAEKL